MSDSMNVFNRNVVRLHRNRAAATLGDHDFLYQEVGERLVDRLDDITKKFPIALDLGSHTGILRDILGKRGGIEHLISSDLSEPMAAQCGHSAIVADEEFLPFADQSLDLVLSNLSLHWVNDLPGCLSQIRRALKPDGLMMATLFGGGTLQELSSVLRDAEVAVEGGLSPRVSPFADIRDAGALMQRAGFALPVVDSETITVSYGDPFKLLRDLRGMGETNATFERRVSFMRKDTLMHAMQLYQERFADQDGRIPATFQILTLSGWAPAPTQQQPMKPGSGQQSLKDFLSDDHNETG